MDSDRLAEIIAEEMEASAREIEAAQRSDAESLDFLDLVANGYLAVALNPPKELPYGLRERRLALEMETSLAGLVCAREVAGGALSIGALPTITASEACRFLKQLIAEEADYQDSLDQTMAAVRAKRAIALDSFSDKHMTLYWVIDRLRDRIGFARCPTCRFEHGFWLKSEKQELCSVCLEPADGVLAPCGHSLCGACFGDLKLVPATGFELDVLHRSSNPDYVEWVRRHRGGESYRTRVHRCRALVAYHARRGLCRRCQNSFGEKTEAAFRDPLFHLERFLTEADKETHESLAEYAGKLLTCTKKHWRSRRNRREGPSSP